MYIGVGETVRLSLQSVTTQKFRSGLTILGIVIGITTVVTVASMLSGLREGIVTFFNELGPDNVFVMRNSGGPDGNMAPPKERKRQPLKTEYADFIKQSCFSVEDVGITLMIPNVVNGVTMTARVPGYESDDMNLSASTPNMSVISPQEIESGRYFTAEENHRGAHVVMIGKSLSDALFPAGKAEGRAVIIGGAEYRVVGVFAKAKGGFFGQNQLDSTATIPFQTARQRYPQLNGIRITAKARSGKRDEALDEVQAAMRRVRNLSTGEEDDFTLNTPEQIIKQFNQITGVIGLVAIAISSLGLLVGGVGVMNIMLMSVTERTREIGTRKAIGARRRDIVGQFLVEAVTLTGLGGIIGLGMAVAITYALGKLVPSIPSTVPVWAVLAGIGTSVAVGVFFGVWPAMKAARLDPVEALRYE
jgi:putative ABC transport system permease protein